MPTLQFKGKEFVENHHLAVPNYLLVPQEKWSLTDNVSLQDNLIIEGDNLLALKALLPFYAGKIKCIYIDPPYNTGNERWAYNDNVNSPLLKQWLHTTVDNQDMNRHDKWLCMMMPRLQLLRELLQEDGVLFISIDDNEQHHLRCLLDEVFGPQNFIQNIIWQKKYSPQNDARYFSDMHDFIICYAKNKREGKQSIGWKLNLLERTETMNKRYANPDKDVRGPWMRSDLSVKTYSKDYDYEIVTPFGLSVKPPRGRCWMTSRERMQLLIADNRIWFGKNNDSVPALKRFLSEVKQGVTPSSIWLRSDVGDNKDARQDLKEIFSEVQLPFDTPKPVELLKRIIAIAASKDDIILDSFSGSGTTAQAVLELNKEDGGNRKFILIEQENYANTITAERVRRVINGVEGAKKESLKNGLGGSFSYFNLGVEKDGNNQL